MIDVQINTANSTKHIFSIEQPCKVSEIEQKVRKQTGLERCSFYIVHNGKLVYNDDVCFDGCVTLSPKLLGGKGGFGSMLRAIGAQIEKTTNREACRDLSGRRLRDINEEKRLKAWIEKQSKREEEAAERKKKKLDRLCATPKHEFKDQNYDRDRSLLAERVGDAVEEGFKAASGSGTKRKITEEFKPNKRKTLLDFEIDSDELGTSDDSDVEESTSTKLSENEQRVSNDSGHSSDESSRTSKNIDAGKSDSSERDRNNQSTSGTKDSAENLEKEDVARNIIESPDVPRSDKKSPDTIAQEIE
ncbi:hypothetical protein KM043_001933 [Ampulex compressa]|nr:hypothetical protein KM043_001933 [Ampulex compressa]